MAALYSLVLAVVVVGPLLGSGYLLLRDAVSTPRSYLTDSALGLGDAAPRAVPQDALLAALSTGVDGGIVVKVILVGALWAAGWGAAELVRRLLDVSTGPQLVATTVAVWNPYVAERLLQGHWSLLAGYAALPWTVLAALHLRSSPESPEAEPDSSSIRTRFGPRVRAWAMLGGCLAAAGLTPTGALLAGCVALVVIGRRNIPGALALWVLASAPWLVATALSGGGTEPSDPAGIGAFAARAEPGLATLGSLAGLGGIWNSDAVPSSRTTIVALIGTVVLLALVAAGIRQVARPGDAQQARRALLVVAALAIVLPAAGATGWGLHAGEFLVTRIPGAGLLRDTQKYVALAMPAFALCAAAGCRAVAGLGRRWGTPIGTPVTAAFCVAALILTLPDLAWGVGGALRPVRYPAGWERVAAATDGPGDVAVLPGGMFRKFPYSGRSPVLDPAPRMLPRDVLQTGELPVRGRMVAGEGNRARSVEQLLLHGGTASDLASHGVGWVLVERTTPGPLGDSATTLAQLDRVYSDTELALYRVPGASDLRSDSHAAHRVLAIAAHLLWALLLAASVAALLYRRSAARRAAG
ncbi:hypothetical protein BJY24_002899 [Nocardia transvalensis]|uniref:Transmembrane protein n=1 Tax=Nocardia transvalensis TaxID=37333 RepID=A0A7W9PD84_9NOCA|nr:hypothetical protein [Nocardia transvalensis]MBB5914032.1 hypothetical protein [Nocardia transvalensis]